MFIFIVIQKLCRRLSLRQAVTATAIVYFRRFYLRNAYCDTDPPLVAAACCYVAAKAEETPVHVKSAVAEAKEVCSGSFPSLLSFHGKCVQHHKLKPIHHLPT